MARRKLNIGDTIKVIGYRPGIYPPGVTDEGGTEKLFKSLVGRTYEIKGFDDCGYIELRPERLHTVWIEPELVELVKDSSHAAEQFAAASAGPPPLASLRPGRRRGRA